MFGPIRVRLKLKRLILASSSPRRKSILENAGFSFDVVPSTFEENLTQADFKEPWQYAVATAAGKAEEVAERFKEDSSWGVVIGADTIVVSGGKILEKPGTTDRAKEMLTMLSGSTHQVFTGVAIVWRKNGQLRMEKFHKGTDVTFAKLTTQIVNDYAETGEPLDKAGGYGIQGQGGTLVEGIHGDYFNVVGLPLHDLCKSLIGVLDKMESTS